MSLALDRRAFCGVLFGAATALAGRRVHAQSAAVAAEARTHQALDELVRWSTAERARLSVLLVQLSTGREIAHAAPDEALNPASNQKLLTMAAALELLGPDFRFTSLLAGRHGTPELAELVLRSDGDPELSSEELATFAESLAVRGYRRVSGDILVDQSAFDASWEPPGYEQRPNDWAAYRAPVSAVSVDRNALTLYVLPDEAEGAARTWFEPGGFGTMSGAIKTGRPGSAQSVGFSVRANGANGATVEASVSGSVPKGRGLLTFSRRLPNPELAAGYALAAKLKAAGIAIAGTVRAGGADVGEALVVRRSRPLGQLLHALGKSSDNFTAEMLLKALGRKATNGQGTSAAGARAVESYLRQKNAFGPGTRIGNGSGLYDANRVSARTLCRTLDVAFNDPRVGPELVASLAIGGVDGTLANRFSSERASRRVRAKTGTLASVTALSGYVLAPSPLGPVAFSILVNGAAGKLAEARRRMDAIVESLARS